MHFRIVCLIVLVIVCFRCAAHAACPSDPRNRGLRAAENRWLQALVNKYIATLDCILSANFTDSSMKGELRTRDDVFADLNRPRDYVQKLAIERVTVKGETGIVLGKNVITDSAGNRLLEIRFTGTFIYEDNRWTALASQETRIQQ